MKGIHITSVGWRRAQSGQSDRTTHEILIGTNQGTVFEAEIDKTDKFFKQVGGCGTRKQCVDNVERAILHYCMGCVRASGIRTLLWPGMPLLKLLALLAAGCLPIRQCLANGLPSPADPRPCAL